MGGYLVPGEQVKLETRPHHAALARPIGRALVLTAVGAIILLLGSPAAWALGAFGALVIFVGAALALGAVLRWDRTVLVLTSEKLLVRYGVVHRQGAAIELDRAGPIEIEQSVFGRLLGYGTVIAGDLEIPYVPESSSLFRG